MKKIMIAILILAMAAALMSPINGTAVNAKGKAKKTNATTEKADEELPGLEEIVELMIKDHKHYIELLIKAWEQRHQEMLRREEDIKLLAEVIYWENWWTDKDKLAAYYTGAVVMNRVNSPAWPNTVKEVLYQKNQYSTTKYFYTKELPEEVYEMARNIIENGTPDVPYDVVYQATFEQGYGKWGDPINGEYFCYGKA